MLKRLPVAIALAAAAHAAPALASCGPANSDFSVTPALPAMSVSVNFSDERVLLGRHGERIPTRSKLVWTEDTGDLTPQTWADKVDWPAYQITDKSVRPAPAKLYFDSEGRLCRVERYTQTRGNPLLTGGYLLAYDASGALTHATEYDMGSGGPSAQLSYTATRNACLVRNAQGALTAYIDDLCGDPKGPGISRHYVRNEAGQLLRVIDTLTPGQPLAVQTFDPHGKPGQRYLTQHSARGAPAVGQGTYGYPAPPFKQDRAYPLQKESLAALSGEIPGMQWRIVRIADDVPMDGEDQSSWDPDLQIVLAKGETDPQGLARLTPQAQAQIWQAMHAHPGRVLFYFDPMGRVVLLPAMTQARWQACGDPANLTPDACGG